MTKWLLLFLVGWVGIAEAACVTVSAPNVPRKERHGTVVALAWEVAGIDARPTNSTGGQLHTLGDDAICFPIWDPSGVITVGAMAARWGQTQGERAQAITRNTNHMREVRRKAVAREELTNDERDWLLDELDMN